MHSKHVEPWRGDGRHSAVPPQQSARTAVRTSAVQVKTDGNIVTGTQCGTLRLHVTTSSFRTRRCCFPHALIRCFRKQQATKLRSLLRRSACFFLLFRSGSARASACLPGASGSDAQRGDDTPSRGSVAAGRRCCSWLRGLSRLPLPLLLTRLPCFLHCLQSDRRRCCLLTTSSVSRLDALRH